MKPQSVVVKKGEVIYDGAAAHHRPRDWLGFSTFAYLKDAAFLAEVNPSRKMNFCEHLMPYEGMDDEQRMPWGVYGTVAFNRAVYLASQPETLRRNEAAQMVVLTVFYEIPNFSEVSKRTPGSIEECGGFLHMGRMATGLRMEWREKMMKYLRRHREESQLARLRDLSWGEFVLHEPAAVRAILKSEPGLNVVVHPVRQKIDETDDAIIQVASFKLNREMLKTAEVRYSPHVPVVCTPVRSAD